jgi:hypothetical protein
VLRKHKVHLYRPLDLHHQHRPLHQLHLVRHHQIRGSSAAHQRWLAVHRQQLRPLQHRSRSLR